EFISARGIKKWVRAAGECEFDDGKAVRLFGIFQDITLEKEAAERLWHAANFDELTRLANRRHFNNALASAIDSARKLDRPLTLVMLDLDIFKEINDTRGHAVGDEILADVGYRLSRIVHDGDFVARLGGDEFALFASRDLGARIERLGEEVLSCLKAPVHVGP